MLQLQHISKTYRTGDQVQRALDDVSVSLRDNEFVAILGPSGSGKTTLLNIIGGLDRYETGELRIDGVSTRNYRDRDWDTYRNHTIGFVFQSYNLIPHQSVLANVELALTIGGISRAERRRRAKAALEEVGLAEHIHKKPSQLSGGQMQRVAIARALVNDPKILLADEPTGALDSATSVQVMDLLREVARDRLVVMVTHNPELAEEYATRIIRLKDGKITDDSDPFEEEGTRAAAQAARQKQAHMSWATALSLSFSNLRTKLGRTLLTAFAGSIGIIGIALILSLSTGADQYIQDIQRDTMTSYPITVEAVTLDLSSWMSVAESRRSHVVNGPEHELDAVYSDNTFLEMRQGMNTSITQNNLTRFKKYLEDETSPIHEYLGENGIVYSYDTAFNVYTYDSAGVFINTDEIGSGARSGMGGFASFYSSYFGSSDLPETSHSFFTEILPDPESGLVSEAIRDNYELLAGRWPKEAQDIILILDADNEISLRSLYSLGFLPSEEYRELTDRIDAGEEVSLPQQRFRYEELVGKVYFLTPACDLFEEQEDGLFAYIGEDAEKTEQAALGGIELRVCGIVRSTADSMSSLLEGPLGYTKQLTDLLIEYTAKSAVIRAQEADPETNILTGLRFAPADDAQKAADALEYLKTLNISEKAALYTMLLRNGAGESGEGGQTGGDTPGIPGGLVPAAGETELAAAFDAMLAMGLEQEVLVTLYDSLIPASSYESNMKAFGHVSVDAPASINLYCDSFEAKEKIGEAIDAYNATVDEEDQITYTDYVGLLMSSVTTIINVISVVLIAFVAVSLVVSSIMIGIITYISVLERTKEIGVLRALGASKRNISEVFNAETLIIGLISGVMGIGIAELLLIPGNQIIHHFAEGVDVSAFIRPQHALFLIALSTLLTLIGGLIPSKKAARRDPVAALRTE